MVVVLQTPHVAFQQRDRSPLGKVAAWFYARAAGTFLQSTVSFLFFDSQIARVSSALASGLILGFLVDFSVHLLGIQATGAISCGVLGIVAGAAAGGLGGGLANVFWPWMIGGVADSIASEYVSDPVSQLNAKILAWLLTAVISWLIGLFAAWLYKRLTRDHPRLRRMIEGFTIGVVLAALSVVLWRLASFVVPRSVLVPVGTVYTILRSWLIGDMGIWVQTWLWVGVGGIPLIWFVYWVQEWFRWRSKPWHRISDGGVLFWLLWLAITLWAWRIAQGLP
jgi:hypothetical protein